MWHTRKRSVYRGKKMKEGDQVVDLYADGRIILKWILIRMGRLRWIHLAQYMNQRRAVVSTVMNLLVS